MYRAFREGLSAVLPVELLALFTTTELEHMFTGRYSVCCMLCTIYMLSILYTTPFFINMCR